MTTFNPPPTYADPVIVDEVTRKAQFNPIWLKWFIDIAGFITASGGGAGVIHNNTLSIQGGTASEYYHVTSAQHSALTAGFTGTGALARAVSPSFTTPALGTPSACVATNFTGTAAGLTAGNVTTNANLTGHVTSVGNAAVLGSFSSAQLATALTDETGSGVALFATAGTTVGTAAALVVTAVALNNGAGVAAGTIGTAPVAGEPTKWIPINDNGTVRYIPAW